MQRKVKTGSGVYAFLEQSGLLEHGTAQEIELAKEKYWATVRKEWKRNKRKESKSYTIFYTTGEHRLLVQTVKKHHLSIAGFIKQASLASCTNHDVINKRSIGEIRQLLALYFFELKKYEEENSIPAHISTQLLNQFEIMERTIMNVLQPS